MATETLKCKKCKHEMEDYMVEYGKVDWKHRERQELEMRMKIAGAIATGLLLAGCTQTSYVYEATSSDPSATVVIKAQDGTMHNETSGTTWSKTYTGRPIMFGVSSMDMDAQVSCTIKQGTVVIKHTESKGIADCTVGGE